MDGLYSFMENYKSLFREASYKLIQLSVEPSMGIMPIVFIKLFLF